MFANSTRHRHGGGSNQEVFRRPLARKGPGAAAAAATAAAAAAGTSSIVRAALRRLFSSAPVARLRAAVTLCNLVSASAAVYVFQRSAGARSPAASRASSDDLAEDEQAIVDGFRSGTGRGRAYKATDDDSEGLTAVAPAASGGAAESIAAVGPDQVWDLYVSVQQSNVLHSLDREDYFTMLKVVLRDMTQRRVALEPQDYAVLFQNHVSLKWMLHWLAVMHKQGVKPGTEILEVLVKRSCDYRDVRRVVDFTSRQIAAGSMPSPEVFSSCITLLATKKQLDSAEDLVLKAVMKGLTPPKGAMSELVLALGSSGQCKRAARMLSVMEECNLNPGHHLYLQVQRMSSGTADSDSVEGMGYGTQTANIPAGGQIESGTEGRQQAFETDKLCNAPKFLAVFSHVLKHGGTVGKALIFSFGSNSLRGDEDFVRLARLIRSQRATRLAETVVVALASKKRFRECIQLFKYLSIADRPFFRRAVLDMIVDVLGKRRIDATDLVAQAVQAGYAPSLRTLALLLRTKVRLKDAAGIRRLSQALLDASAGADDGQGEPLSDFALRQLVEGAARTGDAGTLAAAVARIFVTHGGRATATSASEGSRGDAEDNGGKATGDDGDAERARRRPLQPPPQPLSSQLLRGLYPALFRFGLARDATRLWDEQWQAGRPPGAKVAEAYLRGLELSCARAGSAAAALRGGLASGSASAAEAAAAGVSMDVSARAQQQLLLGRRDVRRLGLPHSVGGSGGGGGRTKQRHVP
ncbi:hypothetical protein HK405_010808, partial [Cladochytrium tenue]